jgi:hypothetical protein
VIYFKTLTHWAEREGSRGGVWHIVLFKGREKKKVMVASVASEKDSKMLSSLSVAIWVMIYTIDFACGLCTSDTISAAQHAVVRRPPAHGARRLQLRGGEGWNGALVMRDLYGKAIKLGRGSYSPFTLYYII